jgi:hypothetical protein
VGDSRGYARRAWKPKEAFAGRKCIECRKLPSGSKRTVAISADSARELDEVTVQHAVKIHGYLDSTPFRHMLKQAIEDDNPHP